MTTVGTTPSPAGGPPATAFFSKTCDEARVLLAEARVYAETVRDRRFAPPNAGLAHGLEALRLTTRLTQITAWLLVQRAVHAGELSPAQARAAHNRLGGHVVCLDSGGEAAARLPAVLRGLLLRSRRLYQRISRLDEMIARDDV